MSDRLKFWKMNDSKISIRDTSQHDDLKKLIEQYTIIKTILQLYSVLNSRKEILYLP